MLAYTGPVEEILATNDWVTAIVAIAIVAGLIYTGFIKK
jgi:hypothetical protein